MLAPAAPRWPSVPPGRGHYESYYLRAVDPLRPRGVWIRYTVAVPPSGRPSGRLWFTVFDREAAGPRALRTGMDDVLTGDGDLLRLGSSAFANGAAHGTVEAAEGTARWRLGWAPGEPPLLHLPRPVYGTRLPRTKLLSLSPATVVDGWLELDGEHIRVDGWPGMVGHNWGEEHAAAWIWLHAVGFAGAPPGTWIDLAMARIRIGRMTTPWSAFGALGLDGRRVPLGAPGHRVTVAESATGCRVRLRGRSSTITVTASAPAAAFVAWDYPNPSGPSRDVVNCSVADVVLRTERPGATPDELTARARGVYERGRERTPRR